MTLFFRAIKFVHFLFGKILRAPTGELVSTEFGFFEIGVLVLVGPGQHFGEHFFDLFFAGILAARYRPEFLVQFFDGFSVH